MYYLSKKEDLRNIIIESSHRDGFTMPPLFYLDKWISYTYITKQDPAERVLDRYESLNKPNYVVFMEEEDIEGRIQSFKKIFPNAEFDTIIRPSLLDRFLYKINPHNKNENIHIYKIEDTGDYP